MDYQVDLPGVVALAVLTMPSIDFPDGVDMSKLKSKDQENDVSSEDTGFWSAGSGAARGSQASSGGSQKILTKKSGRPAWHDYEVESDEQLNDPYFSESFSSAWSSSPYSSNSEQSGSRKGLRKLKNKSLAKDEYLLSRLAQKTAGQDNGSSLASSDNGTSPCLSDASVCPSSHNINVRADSRSCASDDGSEPPAPRQHDRDHPSVDGETPLDLPSVGAALHSTGNCKPCLFVHGYMGCRSGAECQFCHLLHSRSSKARPCKNKRERYKKLVERFLTNGSGGNEESAEDNSLPTTTRENADSLQEHEHLCMEQAAAC
jgi:hypothetical protein